MQTLTENMQPSDREALEERFWSKVERRGPDECWLWTSVLDTGGYGRFKVGERRVRASRLAFALANGPIAEGICVCHRCDRPACVNVSHLFLGTNAENSADMAQKGRAAKGADNGRSRLTDAAVREIVAEADRGVRGTVLAKRFGVTPTAVCCILHGRAWNHVTGIPLRRAA